MVPVEVVADLTVVDDEDRPRVVRVRRVGVVVKLGVQHLADAGYRRPPRPNSLGRHGAGHAKNVQDTPRGGEPVLGGDMRDLQALVLFAVVSSGTPGPNNLLLWASGLQFGFRATVPQIVGTSAGIGALALAVAAGLGVVVTRFPEVELALKLIGSSYLLFLAFQLAGGGAIQRAQIERPLRFHEAAAFQFLNPKGWLFALAAVSTFRPDEPPGCGRQRAGDPHDDGRRHPDRGGLGRRRDRATPVAADQRSRRTLNGALGLLLATSIAFIWI